MEELPKIIAEMTEGKLTRVIISKPQEKQIHTERLSSNEKKTVFRLQNIQRSRFSMTISSRRG